MLPQLLPWANSSSVGKSFLKKDHCPGPDAIDLPGKQDTHWLIFSCCWPAPPAPSPPVFQPLFPQPEALHGVLVTQVQDLAFCLVEVFLFPTGFHKVPQGKARTVTSGQLKCSRATAYSLEIVCHALSFQKNIDIICLLRKWELKVTHKLQDWETEWCSHKQLKVAMADLAFFKIKYPFSF